MEAAKEVIFNSPNKKTNPLKKISPSIQPSPSMKMRMNNLKWGVNLSEPPLTNYSVLQEYKKFVSNFSKPPSEILPGLKPGTNLDETSKLLGDIHPGLKPGTNLDEPSKPSGDIHPGLKPIPTVSDGKVVEFSSSSKPSPTIILEEDDSDIEVEEITIVPKQALTSESMPVVNCVPKSVDDDCVLDDGFSNIKMEIDNGIVQGFECNKCDYINTSKSGMKTHILKKHREGGVKRSGGKMNNNNGNADKRPRFHAEEITLDEMLNEIDNLPNRDCNLDLSISPLNAVKNMESDLILNVHKEDSEKFDCGKDECKDKNDTLLATLNSLEDAVNTKDKKLETCANLLQKIRNELAFVNKENEKLKAKSFWFDKSVDDLETEAKAKDDEIEVLKNKLKQAETDKKELASSLANLCEMELYKAQSSSEDRIDLGLNISTPSQSDVLF